MARNGQRNLRGDFAHRNLASKDGPNTDVEGERQGGETARDLCRDVRGLRQCFQYRCGFDSWEHIEQGLPDIEKGKKGVKNIHLER